MRKNVCYEPDKGPAWKWILIGGMMLALYPVAWGLGKFVGQKRAANIVGSWIPDL